MITEPRWRSGRSPSTPARCGEHTPLPPTMQPYLHIFSHITAPRVLVCENPAHGADQQRRAAAVGAASARRVHAAGTPLHAAPSRPAARAQAGAPPASRYDRPRCDALRAHGRHSRGLRRLARVVARCRGRDSLLAGCGSSSHRRAGPIARPAQRRACVGAAVRRRGRAPTGVAADGALAAGQRAHPPARPLPATARRAADAGLAGARLPARRRAMAGAARGRVRCAAVGSRRASPADSALGSRACWAQAGSAARVPFAAGHGRRRDRARHARHAPRRARFLATLATHAGAHAEQLPRRLLPGRPQAASPSASCAASP